MKIDLRKIGTDVLPALGTIAGIKEWPDDIIAAVGDAVENAEALEGLAGTAKKAKAVEQVQEVAKKVLGNLLPWGVVDTMVQLGWVLLRLPKV